MAVTAAADAAVAPVKRPLAECHTSSNTFYRMSGKYLTGGTTTCMYVFKFV